MVAVGQNNDSLAVIAIKLLEIFERNDMTNGLIAIPPYTNPKWRRYAEIFGSKPQLRRKKMLRSEKAPSGASGRKPPPWNHNGTTVTTVI